MMMTEAYEDKYKTKRVKASALSWIDYVVKDYYCPTKGCNCIVRPKALNSNITTPHFAKIPSSTHIEGCPYIKDSFVSDMECIDTSDFNLIDLLNSSKVNTSAPAPKLRTDASKKKIHGVNNKLTTLRKAYKYFESSNPYDVINGTRIVDMYCGRNTSFFYNTFISGFRLVECQFSSYSQEYRTLRFKFPYGSSNEMIWLKVEDKELYTALRNAMFDNMGSRFPKPVIVLAEFVYIEKYGKSVARITKKEQIAPIKR